jgi:hypothetical protein
MAGLQNTLGLMAVGDDDPIKNDLNMFGRVLRLRFNLI